MRKRKILLCFTLIALLLIGCSDANDIDNQQSEVDTDEGASVQMVEDTDGAEAQDDTQPVEADVDEALDDEALNEVTVLKMATITDGEHNVSGDFAFYSDNTLEISNFYYDGKAPDTFISVGQLDGNNKYTHEKTLGEIIKDPYEGEKLVINLGEDFDIEEFGAVSVYCVKFKDNFGASEIK